MKAKFIALSGVFSVVLLSLPLVALSQQGVNIVQLTNSPVGDDRDCRTYSISEDGSTIAFSSTADLTGQNPDGNVELFVMNSDGAGLLQITDTLLHLSDGPSLTADGSLICFRSTASLVGPNINGANIFLVNSDGTNFRQLTGWGVTSGRINSAGTIVALYTSGNPVGENPDRNYEVFVMNPDGSGIRQLTHTDGTVGPYVSVPGNFTADGSWLVIHSNADLTGSSAGGTDCVYLLSTDGTETRRLTSGHGAYPMISLDGSMVAFHSYDDLLGDSPLGCPEVFVVRPDGTDLHRLTDSYGGGSSPGSITADGSTVAFFGFGDLTGENPDFSEEIFVVNCDGTGLMQISQSTAGRSISPSISADGSFILFRSNADLVGQNPDGSFELFVATVEPMSIEATIDIHPDTLNVSSKGKWITCYIWLPQGYDVANVKQGSLQLNGAIDAAWSWIDEDEQILMGKFPRREVQALLVELGLSGNVELVVTGEMIDGRPFEGTDTIRIIDKGPKED